MLFSFLVVDFRAAAVLGHIAFDVAEISVFSFLFVGIELIVILLHQGRLCGLLSHYFLDQSYFFIKERGVQIWTIFYGRYLLNELLELSVDCLSRKTSD